MKKQIKCMERANWKQLGFWLMYAAAVILILIAAGKVFGQTRHEFVRSEIPNGLKVYWDSTAYTNDEVYFSIDGLVQPYTSDINKFHKRIPESQWPDSTIIKIKALDLAGNESAWSDPITVLIRTLEIPPQPEGITAWECSGGGVVTNMNNFGAVNRNDYVEMRGYNDEILRTCWIDLTERNFQAGLYDFIVDCTAWTKTMGLGIKVFLEINGTEHIICVNPNLPMAKLQINLNGLTKIRFVTSGMDVKLYSMRIQQAGKTLAQPTGIGIIK